VVEERPESDAGKGDRLRAALEKWSWTPPEDPPEDWTPWRDTQAVPVMRVAYSEACQAVEQLQAAGVDAAVAGDASSCQPKGACAFFLVAVLREDLAAAQEVLRSEWKRLLEGEAELAAADPETLVDFDAEGPRVCPACNARFEGKVEECPDCGLYLGVG
jgi:hypothetical protein